jgi:hypothetical protein
VLPAVSPVFLLAASKKFRPFVRPTPEDDRVAVEDWRGTIVESVVPLPQIVAFPQDVAGEVIAIHSGGPVADNDALAVGYGGGVAIPGVVPVPFLSL